MSEHRREAIVVTGASSGIGADVAALLAHEGFLVYAGVRSDADAARVATLHEHIKPVRLDVTDRESIDEAARTIAAGGHVLRALVGNAGIAVAGPLEFLPVDELRRQFEINVFGALAVAQAFLPQLRASRGRLVLVGSISGRLSVPFIAPYSASKFALRALSDALRVELAPAGIAVALIEPSAVKTPIWQKGRDSRDAMLARLPAQAMQYYDRQIEAVFAQTVREEHGAMPVRDVSRAVLHAIVARKPRARYLLGSGARVGRIVALLPAVLRDRALRAGMRLP